MFFFKLNKEDGGGVFGLLVIGVSGYGWWGRSVVNIVFFDVSV